MSLRTIFAVFVVLIGLGAVIWFRLAPTDPSPPTIPAPQVVGRYEAIERGALIATPWVSDDRIYVAAVRDTGLQPTGAIHCLDRATLKPIWTFDDGGAMLHMFSDRKSTRLNSSHQ